MEWLKFHQKIKHNEIMKDKSACHVLFWIFANVDENGEVDFSRHAVARELGEKPTTIYDALKRLTQLSIVSQNPSTKGTRIRLLNWSKYQTIRTETDNEPAADRQQTDNPSLRAYSIKTKNNTYIQLTKRQKEKLQADFPQIKVDFELEKFTAWQKANDKSFPNVLERFRLWLMDVQEKQSQALSRSIQKPIFKVNPIINDPIFQDYLKVYYPSDDIETRKKMALESQLSQKYSTFKYGEAWVEARKQIPRMN